MIFVEPIEINQNGCLCQTDYICQVHYKAGKGMYYDPIKDAERNRPRMRRRGRPPKIEEDSDGDS